MDCRIVRACCLNCRIRHGHRSVDLGFDCWRFWFEFRLPGEFLLGFVEFGFRIALEFEGSSSLVQTGSIILVRVTSSLNFVGSWIFIEAWCVAIGFLEGKRRHTKLKKLDVIKGKFITRKADFTKESIHQLCDSTPTILLLFVGT